jgi:CheY-like chemotaxis protein
MTDVLVIEPAPLVREMVAEALRDAGLRVTEAASAAAALAAVEAAPRSPPNCAAARRAWASSTSPSARPTAPGMPPAPGSDA